MNLSETTQQILNSCQDFQEAKKRLVGNAETADNSGHTWRDHETWLFHPQCGGSDYLAIYDPDKCGWLEGELKVCSHNGE